VELPMHVILWRFRAAPERAAEFEQAYGADGVWAELFAKSSGYRGTSLLRGVECEDEYLTIDRWERREDFEHFRRVHEREYNAIDVRLEALCAREEFVGAFEAIDPPAIHRD
jgi:heme-degrading monooxygenase HmoA